MADPTDMLDLVPQVLVPGRVFAIALRDPSTRAVLIPAGTVLTPALIDQLYRTNLHTRAAVCVGTEQVELPVEAPPAFKPLRPEDFYTVSRLRSSVRGLRQLLAWAAGVIALLFFSTGNPTHLAALGGAFLALLGAYGLQFGLVALTGRRLESHVGPAR